MDETTISTEHEKSSYGILDLIRNMVDTGATHFKATLFEGIIH